jgi:hypothetical protein
MQARLHFDVMSAEDPRAACSDRACLLGFFQRKAQGAAAPQGERNTKKIPAAKYAPCAGAHPQQAQFNEAIPSLTNS